MVFKKEVNPNAGTEAPQTPIEPVFVVDKGSEHAPSRLRVLAIAAKNRKGQVMLHELKARKDIEVVTIVEADLEKNPLKTVKKIIKDELAKENQYHVCYISVSNSDINRNIEYAYINGNIPEININLYFDGHDDNVIAQKAAQYKL